MRLRQAKKIFRSLHNCRATTYTRAWRRLGKCIPSHRKRDLRAKALRAWNLISFDTAFPNAEPFPSASWGDE